MISMSLEEAVTQAEREEAETYLNNAPSNTFIKLTFPESNKVKVELIENPSNLIVSTRSFHGGPKFEKFKTEFIQWQKDSVRQSELHSCPGEDCECQK